MRKVEIVTAKSNRRQTTETHAKVNKISVNGEETLLKNPKIVERSIQTGKVMSILKNKYKMLAQTMNRT